jgi:phosphatidylinositol phospholipase C delta
VLLRGCRCIEIDVYNGDHADSVANTPSAASSPKPDHKRHLSGTTLPSLVAETAEKLEAKYKQTKEALKKKEGLGINIFSGSDASSESIAVTESNDRPPSTKSTRNGEPIVLHGWTLTTPVGFREVCKAVREAAFLKTTLPIIVSLEVHANLEQQEIMVNIMKEEWKGLLIDAAHPTCNPSDRLPRLEELHNKILVKVKKATPVASEASSGSLAPHHAHRASIASTVQSHSPRASTGSLVPGHSPKASTSSLVHFSRHLSISSSTLSPVNSRHDGDSHSGSEDERTSKKKSKICENLSNLGIYTHSEHFIAFGAKNSSMPSHIFSISEYQILDLHDKKREEMFAHNRDFFMRAYPAGFRFNSSNLDPSLFWRKGVQMVALNWQNVDEGIMLNEAMFAGEQGWVLKPPGYRSDLSGTETINYKTFHLRLTVYAGQHIPMPPNKTESGFWPYIRCELHVEKPDESKSTELIEGNGRARGGEYKQKTPHKKGDHPNFGAEGVVMDFPVVTGVVEELSFVRLVVPLLAKQIPPLFHRALFPCCAKTSSALSRVRFRECSNSYVTQQHQGPTHPRIRVGGISSGVHCSRPDVRA